MRRVEIFGVKIWNTTLLEVKGILTQRLINKQFTRIYTPNTEIVMAAQKDDKTKDLINSAELVLPDGIGLIHASKIKGVKIKERVTGFDVSIELLKLANENGYSIFLLGGKENVAEAAKKAILKDYPNIRVSGTYHGYFKGKHNSSSDTEQAQEVVKKIKDGLTDIIFVGLGFPLQEKWIDNYAKEANVIIAIGNGGVMDILSGNSKRAPEVFIRLGLEWFYRLLKDPKRIKRQIVLPLFLIKALFSKDKIKTIN